MKSNKEIDSQIGKVYSSFRDEGFSLNFKKNLNKLNSLVLEEESKNKASHSRI